MNLLKHLARRILAGELKDLKERADANHNAYLEYMGISLKFRKKLQFRTAQLTDALKQIDEKQAMIDRLRIKCGQMAAEIKQLRKTKKGKGKRK